METFTTLITFNYPSEAYVLQSLLESEGIECFLKDEINVQMYSLSSNALGGVKLQIRTSDLERAMDILKSNNYYKEPEKPVASFWTGFNALTENVPFLNKMPPVYRFLLIAGVFILFTIILLLKIAA